MRVRLRRSSLVWLVQRGNVAEFARVRSKLVVPLLDARGV
jgi:hypothetical protein